MKPWRVLTNCILAGLSLVLLYGVLRYGSYTADTIPVINEVCASNFSVIQAADKNYYDYVELYNPTDNDYTMSGLWLSDDQNNPQKFDMSVITVPAHGYAVLWMTEMDEAELATFYAIDVNLINWSEHEDVGTVSCAQYICPVKISAGGEYLYLSNEDARIVEAVLIPTTFYNVSYGRSTDGSNAMRGMAPTPGTSNDAAETVDLQRADTPVFSASSGFYDEAFELTMRSTPGTSIYYTLDGSTPTTASTLYEGAITIDDPSGQPNVYSAHNDIYLDNYVPEDPVDKAVVVRAIAVDQQSGAVSNVVSATYFIGYDDKSVYDNMVVVSLITDPDNLYDYDTGIYVMGAAYDEYKALGGFEGLSDSKIPSSFSTSSGNNLVRYMYTNAEYSGRQWEREVTVQFYNADHNLLLTQDAGMRVAGESSRHQVHKSLNLYARSIYGNKTWQYAFWNYGGVDTIRLRSSGQETPTWKETFVQSLNDGRNVDIQHSIPCAVFLDGEYWGLYQLTEQYTTAYFAGYYGIAVDDLVVYKNHEIIQGDRTQGLQAFDDLEEIITTYDMSVDHLYALAEERVDMESLIDYFCAQTYLGNIDITPHHNQEMWKNTAEGEDNRWRYVLYDLDQTCYDATSNTIAEYKDKETYYWPQYLCANDGFRQQYVTTMMDLANVEYSYNRVHALLANKAATLKDQSIATARRYENADYDLDAYNKDLTALDDFFKNRRHYIERYLREDLGLGAVARLTVTNSDVNAGAVQVNSSVLTPVDYDDAGFWEGHYFTDYAVTLTATPVEGYTFVGWTGDVESGDATITVDMTVDGLDVQAVFEKN